MNIVILAAGQGKRMHSDLPKVLHALGGRPLLSHVLDAARALAEDHGRICVVYGHGGERVRDAFPGSDLVWVKQEPQLGTGHAVQQALPHLDPALQTLVLCGDVPLIRADTLGRLAAEAAGDALSLLTAFPVDPRGYGRIVRVDGEIRRIVEEKDADEVERAIGEVNTGTLICPTVKLEQWLPMLEPRNAQGEYYLTDIVALAAAEGRPVRTAHPASNWEVAGVNSQTQLAALERIHQRNVAFALMEQGVRLADPARFDLRGEIHCGRDVFIDANCLFEGRVEIGDGVVIGPNCVLKDCRIGAGSRIAAFSHVDGAVIGSGCIVGPYARVRPGTELGRGVHVGNFVEVKNSRIDENSKANHLSYVGDATVGRNVNIGAGTITCNYDGVDKHRTVIEDDAFIGSDTQLVAPVTVGHGATLGAGTTLTADAPPEALTVSRVRQVTVAGWKRPVKKKT